MYDVRLSVEKVQLTPAESFKTPQRGRRGGTAVMTAMSRRIPSRTPGWSSGRLLAHGAPDEGSDEAAFARFTDVRDGLVALVAANGSGAVDADAMARLDAATENAVLRVRFDAGGATRLEPTSRDFEGFLSGLFLLVARARSSASWRRLKPCANPECRRVFYDASPSRNGRWCSMRRCGNKLKARTFRRRYPGYGAFAK